MTAPAWAKTRDFEGPILAEEWTRACGDWRVASNRMTRDGARPYYVQKRHGLGGWTRASKRPAPIPALTQFFGHYATPEAAMAAVEADLARV